MHCISGTLPWLVGSGDEPILQPRRLMAREVKGPLKGTGNQAWPFLNPTTLELPTGLLPGSIPGPRLASVHLKIGRKGGPRRGAPAPSSSTPPTLLKTVAVESTGSAVHGSSATWSDTAAAEPRASYLAILTSGSSSL